MSELRETDEKIVAMEDSIQEKMSDLLTNLSNSVCKVYEEKIRQLEGRLANAHNPLSSEEGPLVDIMNDETFYRIDGRFISAEKIKQALLCQEWYIAEQVIHWFNLCRDMESHDGRFGVKEDGHQYVDPFSYLSDAVQYAIDKHQRGHKVSIHCGDKVWKF